MESRLIYYPTPGLVLPLYRSLSTQFNCIITAATVLHSTILPNTPWKLGPRQRYTKDYIFEPDMITSMRPRARYARYILVEDHEDLERGKEL